MAHQENPPWHLHYAKVGDTIRLKSEAQLRRFRPYLQTNLHWPHLAAELLDQIAEHLVERDRDCPWILDESTQLSVELQERMAYHGTKNWKQTRRDIVEASSKQKMSSNIFTFRLVCSAFAASGLRVFLRKAREERWNHYLIFNLPRKVDSLSDLYAGLELMNPRPIAEAIRELRCQVMPDYALTPKLVDNFLEDIDMQETYGNDAEYRDIISRDLDRIWQARHNEQDALVQRAHHYQQALSQLLKHLQTVTIEYKDFISTKQTRGNGALIRQPWHSERMVFFAFHITDLLEWTRLRLLNIGALDLQAQDRALRDNNDRLSPNGHVERCCQALEITFSNRDVAAEYPNTTVLRPEARTEGVLFLNKFRELREFTVSIDDHWGLRPGTLPWLKNALTNVRWPLLCKLSITGCRMTSVTLIGFLKRHRDSLEEVDLQGVWTHRFAPTGHSMQDVVKCLDQDLNMKDITAEEDLKQDFTERDCAHFVKKDDDVIMED